MRFHIQCIGVCAGLLVAFSTTHCGAVELPASQEPQPSKIQGWTEKDRQEWYHTSAGTQLIPYDWFVVLEDEPLKNAFARTGILADPAHPDRLPIGFSKTIGPNVSEPHVGLTCAFCHTTQFTYQGNAIRIEGGPSLQYNQRFLQMLLESLGELKSPDKFMVFATRVLQRRGQEVTDKNVGQLAGQFSEVMKDLLDRGGRDASPALWGPGRFDALGRGGNTIFGPLNSDNLRLANAPVSIPPLWSVWEYDWVQWSGSIQHPLARNIAQVIGVNAKLFAWTRQPLLGPLEDADKFRSSLDLESLKQLEDLARLLEPPRWPKAFPAIDRSLARKGRDLYHGLNGHPNLCAHCHVADRIPNPHPNGPSLNVHMIPQKEVGTDSLYLENFASRRVDLTRLGQGVVSAKDASEWLTTELMAKNGAGNDPHYQHLTNRWRDDSQYIARPHFSVWATAPFLHNGSVPNLYALLSPANERPTCFYLSPTMEFDPVKVGYVVAGCNGSQTFHDPLAGFEFKTYLPGNSNQGHEFRNSPNCLANSRESGILGCELSPDQRWAIIEYLKTCDLDRLVMPKAEDCPDLKEP